MMAGGKAPSRENPHHSHQELTDILVSRFLKALKRKDVKAQNLLSFSQEAAGPQKQEEAKAPAEDKKSGS
jgi:hypothetical protein